ncbi:MAG TPA: hypothetical protein VFO65_01935 [Acidimicrobiales bacterium]|nr:hypothetical protein [Acidimicrobiales bacterium]
MVAPVQVVHVEADGTTVSADVFGGEDGVIMGEVVFRIEDPVERARVLRTFREWEGSACPVTLIEGEDGVVTLVDEARAFGTAIEG